MKHKNVPLRRGVIRTAPLAMAVLLAGCASLPSSGPTGSDIRRSAVPGKSDFPFTLVEVRSAAELPPRPALPVRAIADVAEQPTDLLGPGDLLNVTIYEVGVTLFGSGARAAPGVNISSSGERLPPIRVNDRGYIRVPYVGHIRAAGRTLAELQALIQDGLEGKSQAPQVIVTLQESITNSIILSGEVGRPGRLALSTNRESLTDAIALAGGYRGQAKDLVARVQRGDGSFEIRLSDLLDLPSEDLRVAPGDRITILSQPRSFSVLGAPNRAEEIVFPRSNLSLAQAVALAGGANPNQGDAAAIYVFRYVRKADGTEEPTVFHLNMMRPGAYLLSQRFLMQDRDVLYVGNARANQLTKFVQLLSQLFLPVSTVQSTVRAATTNNNN